MTARRSKTVAFACAVLISTACDRSGQVPTADIPRSARGVPASSTSDLDDFDVKMMRISAQSPAFAGMALDAAGSMRIFVTDLNRTSEVLSAIQPVLAQSDRVLISPRFEKVAFSFSQLKSWEDLIASDALSTPGVMYIDADESANKVTIGLTEAADRAGITRAMISDGVPAGAVNFLTTLPITLSTTLSDKQRPVRSGFGILIAEGGNTYTCTAGLNTHFSGDLSTRYEVVNSHCAPPMGSVPTDSAVMYQQALFSGPTLAGKEYSDPPFTSNIAGCPSGRLCRRSDAALVRFNPSVSSDQGVIGRTQCRNCADLQPRVTIDPSKPTFNIVQTADYPYAGQWLNKMGSMSGWTYGVVTQSCVSQNLIVGTPQGNVDTGLTVLCAYDLNGANLAGDSGAPVFELDANDGALIEGMLFSGDHINNIVMMPIQGIKLDLGIGLVFNQNQ